MLLSGQLYALVIEREKRGRRLHKTIRGHKLIDVPIFCLLWSLYPKGTGREAGVTPRDPDAILRQHLWT